MTGRWIGIVSAATLVLSEVPSLAGPCAQAIDAMQAQVDARIEARAAAGPTAPESTGALLHRQPTPESLAAAEARLGEGRKVQVALDALARARTADTAGDNDACNKALGDALSALNR